MRYEQKYQDEDESFEHIDDDLESLDQSEEIKRDKDGFKLFGLFDVSEAKTNLLEIFACLIAVPGHRGKKHKIQTAWKSGKYSQNMMIVIKCLNLIEKRTKQNPVQVLVTALENAAPRDGITVIEYGGARYPQAVDISPLRRVTMTLRIIVQGSYDKSFNKKTKIEEALADEIIKAFNGDQDSYSMGKKKDSEKQADSAR
jgi:ribosomal protein uS7